MGIEKCGGGQIRGAYTALSDPLALTSTSVFTSLASSDKIQHWHPYLFPQGLPLASRIHLFLYTAGLKCWNIDASIGATLSQ